MKQLYIYIAIIFATLSLFSCEKDETKLEVLPIGEVNVPELTLEGASRYVAEDFNLTIYPNVLSWTKSNFGSPEILGIYTLQVDTTPDFTTKIEKSIGVDTYSLALSGSQLNEWGLNFSLDKNDLKEVSLFMRVGTSVYVNNPTSIINKPDTAFSENITIRVAPMLAEIPVIYVPGNHQGWSPDNAPKLYSEARDNIYTGYVYLNGEFKFTSAPNWENTTYGIGATDGTLSETGGNLTTTSGYYWASVNIKDLTYKLTSVEWSLVGDAIGGWDKDLLLEVDATTGLLKITTNLSVGEFKFRRDKSWDVSLGKTDEEGVLTSKDGANIPIESAGKYTVVLNLSDIEKYTYSVTKQ